MEIKETKQLPHYLKSRIISHAMSTKGFDKDIENLSEEQVKFIQNATNHILSATKGHRQPG